MTASNIRSATKQLHRGPVVWFCGIIAIIVLGWALHAMSVVLIPIAFAVFISLILTPLVNTVEARVPARFWWLGIAAAMTVLFALALVFIGGVSYAIQQLANEIPRIGDQLQSLMPDEDRMQQAASQNGTMIWPRIQTFLQDAGGTFGDRLIGFFGSFAQQAATVIGTLIASMVIVFFLVLLILSEKNTWADKIKTLTTPNDEVEWFKNLGLAIGRLRIFLMVRAIVGGITSIAYVVWLSVFGVDLLIVWAILTFLLTFIPNLGSLISGILPTLYAFLILDPAMAFLVGAGLFIIEQVFGNFIDPKLQGQRIVLSPLVILLALLVWGWIWGAAGALLATPIMILLVIALHNNAHTKAVALMLSNQSDMESLDRALMGSENGGFRPFT